MVFSADPSQTLGRSNGELSLAPDLNDIDFLTLQAAGRIAGFEDHEFSLSALDVSVAAVAPVPLPQALGLFGLGLAMVAARTRRRAA